MNKINDINDIKTRLILPEEEDSACPAIQATKKSSNQIASAAKDKTVDPNQASNSQKSCRTPLPSEPLAPTRFAYKGRAYDSWQARRRRLRLWGIEIHIREPVLLRRD